MAVVEKKEKKVSCRGLELVTSDFKTLSAFSPCRRTARSKCFFASAGPPWERLCLNSGTVLTQTRSFVLNFFESARCVAHKECKILSVRLLHGIKRSDGNVLIDPDVPGVEASDPAVGRRSAVGAVHRFRQKTFAVLEFRHRETTCIIQEKTVNFSFKVYKKLEDFLEN